MSENNWDLLWKSWPKTPESAKTFVNMNGGFTSVKAYTQIELAVKKWGPFGFRWGFEIESEEITHIKFDCGEMIRFKAIFFHPIENNEGKEIGTSRFLITTDLAFKLGQDCYKKIRTGSLTKALSMAGCSHDVFTGQHEDDPYLDSDYQESIRRQGINKQQKRTSSSKNNSPKTSQKSSDKPQEKSPYIDPTFMNKSDFETFDKICQLGVRTGINEHEFWRSITYYRNDSGKVYEQNSEQEFIAKIKTAYDKDWSTKFIYAILKKAEEMYPDFAVADTFKDEVPF